MSITKTDSIVSTHARKIAIADIIEPIRPSHPATKWFVDQFVGGSLNYLGLWDASTGDFPPRPEDQVFYIISETGTIDGDSYHSGDWIIYYEGDWLRIPFSEWVNQSTLVANAPLVFSDGVLSIGAASGSTPGYMSTGPQSFDARKYFMVPPKIPITPVAATDMASKGYVDQKIATASGQVPVFPITYSSGSISLNPTSYTTTGKPVYIGYALDTSGLGTGTFVSLGGASFGHEVRVGGRVTVQSTSGFSPSMIGGAGSVLNLTASNAVHVPVRMRTVTPVVGTDLATKAYADTQVTNAIASLTSSAVGQIATFVNINGADITFKFTKTGDFVTATFDPFTFTATSLSYLFMSEGVPSGFRPSIGGVSNILAVTSGSNNVFGGLTFGTDGDITIFKQIDDVNFISGHTYIIAGCGSSWTVA